MEQENKPQQNTNNNRPGRFGGGRGQRRDFGNRKPREQSEYDNAVLDIARVTRVTGGGKRFSFRTTIVIGNRKGKIGMGMAKGIDVAQSIQKATSQAKKHVVILHIQKGTIAHEVEAKYNSAMVILKPAKMGAGVKAGGPVRVIMKLAGVENISSKILSRTTNKINIAQATFKALSKLKVKQSTVVEEPKEKEQTD